LLSSPIRFSYHANSEGVAPSTPAPQVPAKVPNTEKIRGSNLEALPNSPSAMNPTRQPVANSWTADSLTNAPTAQAATLNLCVHEKRGRELMNELKLRGKQPCYMHFIFGVGNIGCTPSATYMESAPAIPDVPTSDYHYTKIMSTILSYPHLFPIITPIKKDQFEQLLCNHPNTELICSVC